MYVLNVGWLGCLVAVLVWLVGWSVGLAGLVGMDGIGMGIGIGMGMGVVIGTGTNQPTKQRIGIYTGTGIGIGTFIGIGTGTGIGTNQPTKQPNQPTNQSFSIEKEWMNNMWHARLFCFPNPLPNQSVFETQGGDH